MFLACSPCLLDKALCHDTGKPPAPKRGVHGNAFEMRNKGEIPSRKVCVKAKVVRILCAWKAQKKVAGNRGWLSFPGLQGHIFRIDPCRQGVDPVADRKDERSALGKGVCKEIQGVRPEQGLVRHGAVDQVLQGKSLLKENPWSCDVKIAHGKRTEA